MILLNGGLIRQVSLLLSCNSCGYPQNKVIMSITLCVSVCGRVWMRMSVDNVTISLTTSINAVTVGTCLYWSSMGPFNCGGFFIQVN